MALSQARVLHSNPTASRIQGARILPFRRMKLPAEQPGLKSIEQRLGAELKMHLTPEKYKKLMEKIAAKPELYADAIKEALARINADAIKGIKAEAQREAKAKGGFRRSGDLPSEHYVLAWLVWYVYVRIMLSSGLRVEDNVRRPERDQLHQPLKRAS